MDVLNFNPKLRTVLNFYMTPEPFFTHRLTEKLGNINVLIIENKDTWYTLKSIMTKDKNNLLGICFDSLLYGEGKKISRKQNSLAEFDKTYFMNCETTYYYFGDLDYEGIGIYNDLKNTNPELSIRLFVCLYSEMLNVADLLINRQDGKFELPKTKEKQSKKSIEDFLSEFNKEEQIFINKILKIGRYIPQEILNRGSFCDMIK